MTRPDNIPDAIGAYVTALEEQVRRQDDKYVRLAVKLGACHRVLQHSADRCDTVTDLRVTFNDVLDELGVTP